MTKSVLVAAGVGALVFFALSYLPASKLPPPRRSAMLGALAGAGVQLGVRFLGVS